MAREDTNIFMKHSVKHGLIFREQITEKRRETNPYISKVEASKNIMIDEAKIFEMGGKWNSYFENENPIYLEIGTGLGNFFSNEVARNPDKNFIGVELKYKRVYITEQKTIEKCEGVKHPTRFVLLKTKGQNIKKFLSDSEIERTYIFFPDPWGKKERQKKHRIFQEDFIKDLYNKTKERGRLIFKTDHREYFESTLEIFDTLKLWKKVFISYDYEKDSENYDKKEKTEFETIFHDKKVCYVEFKKDSVN